MEEFRRRRKRYLRREFNPTTLSFLFNLYYSILTYDGNYCVTYTSHVIAITFRPGAFETGSLTNSKLFGGQALLPLVINSVTLVTFN